MFKRSREHVLGEHIMTAALKTRNKETHADPRIRANGRRRICWLNVAVWGNVQF